MKGQELLEKMTDWNMWTSSLIWCVSFKKRFRKAFLLCRDLSLFIIIIVCFMWLEQCMFHHYYWNVSVFFNYIVIFFFITFPSTCILKNVFNEINQIYCDKVLFCAQHTHTTIHCQLKTLFLSSTTTTTKKWNVFFLYRMQNIINSFFYP